MKLPHSRPPATTKTVGAGAKLADPNAAKNGTPQTRLLTPAVQRVIAWHQERIAAQADAGPRS